MFTCSGAKVSYGEGEMGLEIFCMALVQETKVRMCNLQKTCLPLPLKYIQTKLGSPCGMLTEQRQPSFHFLTGVDKCLQSEKSSGWVTCFFTDIFDSAVMFQF